MNRDNPEFPQATKRPYTPPRLTCFGTVQEHTGTDGSVLLGPRGTRVRQQRADPPDAPGASASS